MGTSILVILVIGLPWLGALLVWMASRVVQPAEKTLHTLAAVFSVAGGITALGLLFSTTEQAVIRLPVGELFGDLTFVPDGLGVFLAAIAAVIGSLAVIFSIDYMRGDPQLGRYYALVLLFIGAMAGLVLTGSFLFLFIFWEITALCSYALISFYNDDPKAVRGGIKALIITQVGGAGLLAGALIAYSQLGSFEIRVFLENASQLAPNLLAWMAFGFLAAGAAKSAQVPFHTWLPDAMEAPTPVSALIHAATMVNAGVYLLARFFPAFEAVPGWRLAVVAIGILSALLAACTALVANDLKRVLAYSTISQLGYMVFAIGAGGVFASQFHLLNHAVFKALLFLCAGAVIHTTRTRDLSRMGGLGKQMPFVRNAFMIGALALAGVPILNGFWSKELVLEAAAGFSPWLFYLGVLGAGLTALYTFRLAWLVFFGTPRSEQHVHDAGTAMRAALLPLVAGALLTWLAAGALESFLGECHSGECSLAGLATEILTSPTTFVTLTAISLGAAAWWQRERWWQRVRLSGLSSRLSGLARLAGEGFGFEWINDQVVALTRGAAGALQKLQTGQLNWNLAGIVGGLLIVLILLAAWGA